MTSQHIVGHRRGGTEHKLRKPLGNASVTEARCIGCAGCEGLCLALLEAVTVPDLVLSKGQNAG